jgi:uncharacterized protein involved in exopolysaccharide biosynthesis
MSANLTPVLPGSSALAPVGASAPVPYRPGTVDAEQAGPSAQSQVRRLLAAVGRYKWLTAALGLLGLGAGYAASTLVEPQYAVQSTLLLTGAMRGASATRGPIQQEQVFEAQGWMDLLRSTNIADSVVLKLALYVEPDRARDTVAFRTFQLNLRTQRFVPGQYALEVAGARWTLRDKLGLVNEQGVVGDSIGRTAGFAWAPSRAALGSDRTIKFRVRQPREAAVDAIGRFRTQLAVGSNLIFVNMVANAAQKPAETLNAWSEQFIRLATDIKTGQVSQQFRALEEQRAIAERDLATKERAYEQFRVRTIDQPSEALAIQQGPGGMAAVRNDPAMDNYTASKYQLESVRRQRAQLQQVGVRAGSDNVPVAALLNVDVVNTDPVATGLKQSLAELQSLDVEIRNLRRVYQDSTLPLKPKLVQRRQLATAEIPRQVSDVVAQLQQRERQLGGVVSQSSGALRSIPGRTTQLEALRRDRDAAAALFTNLNQRYSEVQLAERSMTPDVRVLDRAVMPSEPTRNTLPALLGGGLAAGLGLGLALSVLLDRVDRKFRYPEQVTHGLNLQVLGVVPEVDQSRPQSPERVAQIVEAFRTLRMNVRYACMPNTRVALTVTSPGPNDGKSLVASNLALSLAEGGWRTCADRRRPPPRPAERDLRPRFGPWAAGVPRGHESAERGHPGDLAREPVARRDRAAPPPRPRASRHTPDAAARGRPGHRVRRRDRRLAPARRRDRRLRAWRRDREHRARRAPRGHGPRHRRGQAPGARLVAGPGDRRSAQRGGRVERHVPTLRVRPRVRPGRGRRDGRHARARAARRRPLATGRSLRRPTCAGRGGAVLVVRANHAEPV